ncbi:hypothetical protein XH98_15970 [Bradyrhizobium sp. CCBAU 51745]|uniref:hypothetical protein n=1 Tax=Bradyrhizobium sp. CCBAU 51745 TaxID=1325099 RepID=UPI0023050C89|nr:hypothetical protein [Bradyrhizobium sp. CCBAU 51745]MDA9440579.1 hypothetical protein [Bradyrhizobium sp. CCBAU 51745]
MVAATPPTIDVQAGVTALEEDIPRVLRLLNAEGIEQLGWSRPNRLTLLIPMTGIMNAARDDYLLRLGFQAYRRWPPSAQFVNPATLAYQHPVDQQFVPRLTSSECQTHTAYSKPGGGTLQLICCSAVLEFYEVLHDVQPEHIWRDTDTFFKTITAIRRAFATAYSGRF